MALIDILPEMQQSLSPEMSEVFKFHNMLLGSWIKTREIHYNTRAYSHHKLTDKFMGILIDYMDQLGEGIQGFDNMRVGYDTVVPIIPRSNDLEEIIQVLQSKSLELEQRLSNPIYSGIVNILDDLRAQFNKFNYLNSFH